MKKQKSRDVLNKLGLAALIWILAFQNPLESVWKPFSYIDEFVALIGACLGLYDIVIVRKGRPSKDQLRMGIPLLVFIAVGLTGNLIYQYQPIKSVIIDLYTNLKFFFAIGTGYYLFASLDWDERKKTAQRSGQVIALILFSMFLADRVFCFWPAEERYGIPSTVLFYSHPTYLAGAMAFLLVLLTSFYDKTNLPCIAMALTIMVFTLRAKSLASAAVYVFIFVFFLVLRWKLRLWHIVAAGVGSIAIAWHKIRFYFIDLGGSSARSVILQKSFAVMKDHFPIGTGFGTYGSAEAEKHYSPVYLKYGLHDNYQLRDVTNVEYTMGQIERDEWLTIQYQLDPEGTLHGGTYLTDHFWPTVFGQGGILGTLVYLVTLGILAKHCLDIEKYDHYGHAGVLFILVYLIISSFAEPAFFNSVAIPLAVVMGMVFSHVDANVFT